MKLMSFQNLLVKGQVGSSTMPHKRNPAIVENAACKSNTLKANLSVLTDMMKTST